MKTLCRTFISLFRRLVIPSTVVSLVVVVTIGSVYLLVTKIKRKVAYSDTSTATSIGPTSSSVNLAVEQTEGSRTSISRSDTTESSRAKETRSPSLLERTAEEFRRKLAKLRDSFEIQAIDAVAQFNGLFVPFRQYSVRKATFDYQLDVRRNNPLLELPLGNPPEPIDRLALLNQFRQIANDFEQHTQLYVKNCQSEQFQFFKETSSIPRVGNEQRDFLIEACELEPIRSAIFMVHARGAIEQALRDGDGDLEPFLVDVPPVLFSQRIQVEINQHRKSYSLPACQLDQLLDKAAQEHALSMAINDKLSADRTANDELLIDRVERNGGHYIGLSSHALSTGATPSDVPSIIEFFLSRERDREYFLSDKSSLGVGVCKSDRGTWYVSILLGGK